MVNTPQTRPGLSTEQRRAHTEATKRTARCMVIGSRTIPLVAGEFVIGRSSSCAFLLDDALVSRQHAQLSVTDDAVFIADLGSTNGVYLNEARLVHPAPLRDGDRLLIGSMELSFFVLDVRDVADRQAAQARVGEPEIGRSAEPASVTATHKADVLERVGRLADRALAEGRAEVARALLADHLQAVLAGARDGRGVPPGVIRAAGDFGLKLAAATGEGAWIDLVIELHMISRRPLTASVIAGLSPLLASISGWDHELFRMYQAVLQGASQSMGPDDRALCESVCKVTLPTRR